MYCIPENPLNATVQSPHSKERRSETPSEKICRRIMIDLDDVDVSKLTPSAAGYVIGTPFEEACMQFVKKGYYAKLKYLKESNSGGILKLAYIVVSKYPLRDNSNEKYYDKMFS